MRTKVGPTCGSAPKTWGGAVFGSSISLGATTIASPGGGSTARLPMASPSAAAITVAAKTPRGPTGQIHDPASRRGASSPSPSNELEPGMLDIRFVSPEMACL